MKLVSKAYSFALVLFFLWSFLSATADTLPAPPFKSNVMLNGPCTLTGESVLPLPISGPLSGFFPATVSSIKPGYNYVLGGSTTVGGLPVVALRYLTALTEAGRKLPGASDDLSLSTAILEGYLSGLGACRIDEDSVQAALLGDGTPGAAQVTGLQQDVTSLAGSWLYQSPPASPLSRYDQEIQGILLTQYQDLLSRLHAQDLKAPSLQNVAWLDDELHDFFDGQLQLAVDCRQNEDPDCPAILQKNGEDFESFFLSARSEIALQVINLESAAGRWASYANELQTSLQKTKSQLTADQGQLQAQKTILANTQNDLAAAQSGLAGLAGALGWWEWYFGYLYNLALSYYHAYQVYNYLAHYYYYYNFGASSAYNRWAGAYLNGFYSLWYSAMPSAQGTISSLDAAIAQAQAHIAQDQSVVNQSSQAVTQLTASVAMENQIVQQLPARMAQVSSVEDLFAQAEASLEFQSYYEAECLPKGDPSYNPSCNPSCSQDDPSCFATIQGNYQAVASRLAHWDETALDKSSLYNEIACLNTTITWTMSMNPGGPASCRLNTDSSVQPLLPTAFE